MKIILTVIVVAFSLGALSQKVDERLLKSYSTEELTSLKENNGKELEMLNYALDNALYVVDIPKGKQDQLDGSLDIPGGEYDFTDLGIRPSSRNQYYRIIGTDKMLIVKSKWVLMNEIKKK